MALLGTAAQAAKDEEDVFLQARDAFLSSLAPEYHRHYSPCKSPEDLILSISKLELVARHNAKRAAWINGVTKIVDCLKPYFEVIDVLVSSHPEYAAVIWGALRLVFQLAVNFSSFFDKLLKLLEHLVDTFPQYDMMLELCDMMSHDKPNEILKLKANKSQVRRNIEAVYRDILQIIQAAARVFMKSDGQLKKTSVVIGELMWKPFHARFGDLIQQMADHRKALFEELLLQTSNGIFKDRVNIAAMRELMSLEQAHNAAERQLAAEERRLAKEERLLMADKRQQDAQARQNIENSLTYLRAQMKALEHDRVEKTRSDIRNWIAAPDYLSAYERASKARHEGTATWIFKHSLYLEWLQAEVVPPTDFHFGPRALWIYGHPGAGKTVLATSITSNLHDQGAITGYHVYYFFFEHHSGPGRSAISAYRSLLAQMFWEHQSDRSFLDRFAFIMTTRGQGNPVSSEFALIDLLKFSLPENSILILDGLDECADPESVVRTFLEVSRTTPSLRLLFLSRVTVTALSRSIIGAMRLQLVNSHLALDIKSFYDRHLGELFDQRLLPQSARPDAEAMTNRLLRGADGMFLWANLMIKYLRSGFLTPHSRVDAIMRVSFPEGLEAMYERIVALVLSSGTTASTIASRVLTLLLHSLLPMSSRQIRQALIADGSFPVSASHDDIHMFEEAVITACGGLVESQIVPDTFNPDFTTPQLRLIHFSVEEMLKDPFDDLSMLSSSRIPRITGLGDLLLDPANASLYLADCCLRQLLCHTPAQPLSGRLNQRITETQLSSDFCFTDHSAVLWIGYLHNAADMIQDHNAYRPARCALFKDPLVGIVQRLWTFIKQPRTLSVWLESYYTAVNHRSAIGYIEPPTNLFAAWASSLQVLGGRSGQELSIMLRDLSRDIDDIVKVWGDKLEKAPEIIWDEMTGFKKSQFFFNVGSTQVSTQEPTPPSLAGLSAGPIAVVSRTAEDGRTKGVLSVWAPRELYDKRYAPSVTSSTVSEDLRVSSGWMAVYEIWDIRGSTTRSVRVECKLDPMQVLHHTQRYINQAFPRSMELPLAISSDVLSFTALLTIFVVQPGPEGAVRCFSRVLPVEHPRPDRTIIWFRYDTYISGTGNYLVFHDKTTANHHVLIMFRYLPSHSMLAVEEVGKLDLGKLAGAWNVTFHPRLTLMAFKAVLGDAETPFTYAIVIWIFNRAARCVFIKKFDDPIKTIKSMRFSLCGSYLIYQTADSTAGSRVISVPSEFLDDTLAIIAIPKDTIKLGASIQDDLSITRIMGKLAISRLGDPPKAVTQSWTVGPDKTATPISISLDRGDFHLSVGEGSQSQTAKVVAVPPSYNLDAIRPTLIPPQTAGDALKVSTDRDVRPSYPMSQTPVFQTEAPIAVFGRDPRFITAPRPLGTILGSTDQSQAGFQGRGFFIVDESSPADSQWTARGRYPR